MLNTEWIELKCGAVLHDSTVIYRQRELGWSAASAKSTPVNHHRGMRGRPNVAARARADYVSPPAVQLLMRQYDVTYEEARDHIRGLQS